MLRSKLKFVVAGLLAALAGSAQTLAQAPQTDRPADPQIIIRRDGKITNVIVTDENNARLTRMFAELRQLPPASDAEVAGWIAENQSRLPPYFLYELARRTFATDRDAALAWFLVAGIRARYDALRCVDRSAGGNVVPLPQLALAVAEFAAADRARVGRIGLGVMRRADLFQHEASPWWICSQGIRNTTRALEGGRLGKDEWLKPETEWPALRNQLASTLERYFVEQGKPQTDPIPAAQKTYAVTTLPEGWSYDKIMWVDERRLAVHVGRGGSTADTIQVWSRENGLTLVATNTGYHFCAGNGNVAYLAKAERSPFERGKLARFKVTAMVGPPDRLERIDLEMTDMLTPAHTEQTGGQSWTKRADGNPYKQSGIDCRWAKAARVSERYLQSHWIPLLPGHGFLGFKGKNGRSDAEVKETVFFHPRGDAEGRALAIDWPGLGDRCVRYYAFKRAYFISVCGLVDEVKAELLKEKCMPGWWFHPEGARLEGTCGPIDDVTKHMIAYEPTKVGLLRIVQYRNTYHGKQPGGLYLTDAAGRTERIYTHSGSGWIADARVSPDGCRVAFRELTASLVWHARVLTLC